MFEFEFGFGAGEKKSGEEERCGRERRAVFSRVRKEETEEERSDREEIEIER